MGRAIRLERNVMAARKQAYMQNAMLDSIDQITDIAFASAS